jgi:hypothetical protein
VLARHPKSPNPHGTIFELCFVIFIFALLSAIVILDEGGLIFYLFSYTPSATRSTLYTLRAPHDESIKHAGG